MPTTRVELDQLCVNAIRTLSIDAVQKANSGHPGAPLGLAPLAYVLWDRAMRYSPRNPDWPNRDRFVLSAGHASMLLYSSLFLTGYDISLDDLKNFRQWGSKTPGHPERELAPGVEVTTGPLGQGAANAVGMGIAQAHLAKRFNRPGFPIVDNDIYAICSDGDMMEGISHEAASLAGTLKLDNLIFFFDSNSISLDGPTSLAFTEDTAERFRAYGWHVQTVNDGNNLEAIEIAIESAKSVKGRPHLIVVRTVIGYGSAKYQGTAEAHGKALGEDEVVATKKNLGWPSSEPFFLPDEALAHMRKAVARGAKHEEEWNALFARYSREHPDLAREFTSLQTGDPPEGFEKGLPVFEAGKAMATRNASSEVIQALAKTIPTLFGGSADLASSTFTMIKGAGDFGREDYSARNIWFGVREHAMGAAANGMAAYGGVFPYTGTFFTFSDYMRPAIRLACLTHAHVVHVFTHDSIGLGEDGPTHQPVEHLAALRAIPNYVVLRPGDANEVREAWVVALQRTKGPTALVLTRQNVPTLDRKEVADASGLRKGAYVLWQSADRPQLVLIASGSEVSLAFDAAKKLATEGVRARVVSMPSWEIFAAQSKAYRDSVLPPSVKARLAVEAGTPFGWERWVGESGDVLGVTTFGASAPAGRVFKEYGFTVENVIARAKAVLERAGK